MELVDPFIWLEDLESSRTKEFIKMENKRFREYINGLNKLFIERIKSYYLVPVVTWFKPCTDGVYAITRDARGYKLVFINWDGVVQEIMSSRDIGGDTIFSAVYPSRDCSLVALECSTAGSDEGYVDVFSVDTLEKIDRLAGCIGDIVWIDKYRYYYVRFYRCGETIDGVKAPAERVFLRDTSGSEEMVFGKGIPSNHLVTLYPTWDYSRLLIMVSYGWSKSSVYAGVLDNPCSWRLIASGGEHLVKPAGFYAGAYYLVYYDREGLGRIVRVYENGSIEEVVSETKYPIEEAIVVRDRVYAVYIVDGSNRVVVYSLDGVKLYEHSFNEPSSIHQVEAFMDKIVINKSSFNKPATLYILAEKHTRELYGAGIDLGLRVREEWTTSSDGTRIHYFIVEKEGVARNQTAIVYGYGGFGLSVKPFYLGMIYPYLEDGGLFIAANLRGGGEYGEKWHRTGMRENKQMVFEDYKAVLKSVREKGFKTIAWGISNGGLLVAATLTQSPELVDTAVIGYPVIDMLRFHKLYIGRLWTTEYGDPDNPRDREYLLKYSPYHNLRGDVEYPPTLVYTGLHDDRVHPAHALKFVARLQSIGAKAYLRVETSSGHRGSTPEVRVEEYSDILAFIYKTLGLTAPV